MGARLFLCLAASILLSLTAWAEPPDAFLDGPMPMPKDVPSFVLLDQVHALQAITSHKMIFPDGFIAFLQKTNMKLNGRMMPFSGPPKTMTVRECLTAQARSLGMAWSYDPARDAIIVDFLWHKSAFRPASDLLHVLLATAPPYGDKLPHVPSLDKTWGPAFGELLSRPENFVAAWKTRLSFTGDGFIDFLSWDFAQLSVNAFTDHFGAHHVLVLAVFDPPVIPGPPPHLVYFLFDHAGKLEDGGDFTVGNSRSSDFALKARPDGVEIERVDRFATRWGYTMSLHDSGASWGDFNWGWPSIGFDTANSSVEFRLTTTTETRYKLQLTAGHGKVVDTCFKNGSPYAPGERGQSQISLLNDLAN